MKFDHLALICKSSNEKIEYKKIILIVAFTVT